MMTEAQLFASCEVGTLVFGTALGNKQRRWYIIEEKGQTPGETRLREGWFRYQNAGQGGPRPEDAWVWSANPVHHLDRISRVCNERMAGLMDGEDDGPVRINVPGHGLVAAGRTTRATDPRRGC